MSAEPIANTEQAKGWNEVEGRHWVANQARFDTLNFGYTGPLLDAASIADTDAVLDIGCGNGQTTRLAAQRASRGRVVGFDLSVPMLERAAATAAEEGITNVTFEQGDAQVHRFPLGRFDVAISRFGVMFFNDPAAAFANIAAVLRPGGRIAFLCWQDRTKNEWLMVPAAAALQHVEMPDLGPPGAPGPFALAEADRIREILSSARFEAVDITSLESRMRMGDDAEDAADFVFGTRIGRALLEGADGDASARAVAAVTDVLRSHEGDDGVYLNGAAWLVTART